MKRKKNTHYLKINIDNPCSERWAAMRREANGRFCSQCEKIVRDFEVVGSWHFRGQLPGISKVPGNFSV